MELCQADISRLVRRGYSEGEFMIIGQDRIPRLRNVNGHCFFFDRDQERCREYAARPLGCSIYPVNLTDEGDIIIDDLCPEGRTLTKEEVREKGERLRRLLDTIDAEAIKRQDRIEQ